MTTSSRTPVDMEEATDRFENQVETFKRKLTELESRALQPDSDIDLLVEDFTEAFHQSREDCLVYEEQLQDDSRALAEAQRRFRDELAHWFDQSWFFDRAKQKPRGYPGDFVMLTALYDEQPKSHGFGEVLDRYFLNADLARAVRTRLANVKQFIREEIARRQVPLRILDVASGPGREFASGFEEVTTPVKITCLDSDEEALQYLKDHIAPEVAEKLEIDTVCYNALKTTSAEKNIANFGLSDIIYSVGLCDYIPDRYMIRILAGWRESVADGGIVYVAFKDSRRYMASEYQWHADWHFYQRTEEDCRSLFEQAGYDVENMEMFRDETGIIMNFISRIQVPDAHLNEKAHALRGPHFRLISTEARTSDDATAAE